MNKICVALQFAKRNKFQYFRKFGNIREISKFQKSGLVLSLPSRKKTLAMADKHYGGTAMKIVLSFPFLLDFFTFPRQVFSRIVKQISL